MTMADPNASGKTNRFVGICIQRGGKGLGATFVLRNIIDNQGEVYLFSAEVPVQQKSTEGRMACDITISWYGVFGTWQQNCMQILTFCLGN